MMVWIVTGVVLGVLALAALSYFGLRVWQSLRVLTKEVKRVTPMLTEAAAPVQAQLSQLQAGTGAPGESLSPVR
ncbi:MAG TPA: hypothetical protein VGX23_15775 [Actinocrinis sp.]|nr:hypothetical protein [Actinocrinis sp.]